MRWLSMINLLLIGFIGITLSTLFFVVSKTKVENFPPSSSTYSTKMVLPKNSFVQKDEAYRKLGGAFALKWVPPKMQLPDLRNEVIFYGKNGRPDVRPGEAIFHIALKDEEVPKFFKIKEKIYLIYEGNFSALLVGNSQKDQGHQTPLWNDPAHNFSKGCYRFSPNNMPTPLWIELSCEQNDSAEICVSMVDESGTLISTPSDFQTFSIRAQEGRKGPPVGWELGGIRVDASFLVRQRARWLGTDIFLEHHGGEEFAEFVGKERIEFAHSDAPYSCLVGAEDRLIWDKNRWLVVTPSMKTEASPLLVLNKINEKVMNFELWDSDGRGKIALNLIRSQEHEKMPDLLHEFKFVGAKTWSQFIVESPSERLVLRPHDWLVFTDEGWHKIDSPEKVDEYVNHELNGPLFILDKMIKQNGRQTLIGHLYNSSRTQVQTVELPASQNSLVGNYHQLTLSPPPGEHLISPPHTLKAEVTENQGNEE